MASRYMSGETVTKARTIWQCSFPDGQAARETRGAPHTDSGLVTLYTTRDGTRGFGEKDGGIWSEGCRTAGYFGPFLARIWGGGLTGRWRRVSRSGLPGARLLCSLSPPSPLNRACTGPSTVEGSIPAVPRKLRAVAHAASGR